MGQQFTAQENCGHDQDSYLIVEMDILEIFCWDLDIPFGFFLIHLKGR
jgi:hypothetical protein